MPKELIFGFTIKPISSIKLKQETKSFKTVGKKCKAVVIEDNGIFKAKLISSPVENNENELKDIHIIPFSEESFNLKGKTHVFLKEKDKYGHLICIIRDEIESRISPGTNTQYDVLKKGLRLIGHVVNKHGKHYFNYEELDAYTENGPVIGELNK